MHQEAPWYSIGIHKNLSSVFAGIHICWRIYAGWEVNLSAVVIFFYPNIKLLTEYHWKHLKLLFT